MQATGEARWARHHNSTWHAKKCKLYTVMRGVSAAGLEEGAVVASEVVEARLVQQIVAWVEACSKRALFASLLFDLSAAVEAVLAAYPGLHTRLNVVPRYQQDSDTVDDVEEVVDQACLERGVNRGSLLRHAVDTSRQLEEAHASWQLDWADWQAGGQRNTWPYRPPSPFAVTTGCSCKAHHIKLDTKAIYGLMRTAGMLPADITSLPKFRNVTVSVMFMRPKPAGPPDADADWLGCDPGKTNMATVAHEERHPSGAGRQSGIAEHVRVSNARVP
ncbi:hypothetical protein QJQ45_001528 [Haematococcus lacustris]|nr:hypothetical protein QJQ45_001528 [Haematococcus lacustris]